jgi:flagellar secretion chaperone FliS
MDALDDYQSQKIMSASPLELVEMLYRGAVGAVQAARRHLARNEIRERSHKLSKLVAILSELSSTLNHEQGGEVSRNLAELYDYIQRLVIDGNVRQVDGPLQEAERLLETLLRGWSEMRAEAEATVMRPVAGYAESLSEREPISVSY